MSGLSLFFLGPPKLEKDGIQVQVSRRKAVALIAYLAVSGGSHSRDALVGLLWPDYDQSRARAFLRRDLSVLKRALGEGWFEVEREKMGLQKSEGLWLDVDQFQSCLSKCKDHGHGEAETCAQCVKLLTEAVGLYRDDLLSGFSLQDSVNFDDWHFFQTQDLRAKMVSALERLVLWHRGKDELERTMEYSRRWLELDRTDERAHRLLMESYAKTGGRAAALRQYEECVKTLERELGEAPQEETVLLYESIKKKRTKSEVSSGKSVDTATKANLPRQLKSFIGRENEIDEVKGLLSTTPLLTLTGSGGCGKTRLALEVAAGLVEEYDDGVWLVELAALSDPALITQEVVSVLGVREVADSPLLDMLSNYLHTKDLLLILDNCEHLIEACARLSDSLLSACPNLRILSTSREGLGIGGETTYRIPSLSLPDPVGAGPSASSGQALVSVLMQYEAIRLFIDRAVAIQPTFKVTNDNAASVAQICQRLDGIPLAIELAAVRVKVLELEEITDRLGDCFRLLTGGSRTALPRQQTLRATIDWSYNLLSEQEGVLLGRLSVFMGGWSLEAAEAICADTAGANTIRPNEVLDLLTNLVDKSLIVTDGASSGEEVGGKKRYRLLETVRQYARDKLIEAGEAESLHERHLKWYLGLAEGEEPELQGTDRGKWQDRLDLEHDNLRGALEWSLESGDMEMGLRLAEALLGFWVGRGYWNEGRQWFDILLSRSSGVSTPLRAKALYFAGGFASFQGDREQEKEMVEKSLALYREIGDKGGIATALQFLGGEQYLNESLSLFREIGDKRGISESLRHLGTQALGEGDYEKARELFEESLAFSEGRSDNPWVILNLGYVALHQGELVRAAKLSEESLSLHREHKNKFGLSYALRFLGLVVSAQGDFVRALALLKEGLVLSSEMGLKGAVLRYLGAFGELAVRLEDPEGAARLFGAAEALRETDGPFQAASDPIDYDRNAAALRAELGEDECEAAWAEGRAMSMEEAIEYALTEE